MEFLYESMTIWNDYCKRKSSPIKLPICFQSPSHGMLFCVGFLEILQEVDGVRRTIGVELSYELEVGMAV